MTQDKDIQNNTIHTHRFYPIFYMYIYFIYYIFCLMLILRQLHQVKFLVSATHEVTSNIVRNSKDETILHMFATEN